MENLSLTRKNLIILIIVNAVTVILFLLAWTETMLTKKGALIASGFAYLRYYTVISNVLFAIMSLVLLSPLSLFIFRSSFVYWLF